MKYKNAVTLHIRELGQAVRVARHLWYKSGGTGRIQMYRADIATDLGMSVSTVNRHIDKLKSNGWLVQLSRPNKGKPVAFLCTIPEREVSE
ncbi:helix-turn-helix domain-containing protein [Tsukamurella ocularis]|uniref:helix-turn-helix domain-containing protein n=1 Tax=Tsukamurella ocularis TaxID=1970234 RepID=UPI0039EFFEB9